MSSRPLSEPRRPCLIVSPSALTHVGSPTMQWSNSSPLASAQSRSLTVPLTAGPSSSPVMRKLIEPCKRRLGDEAQGGGDGGGDAALHVAGAAAKKLAVGDLGRERIEPPALDVAGRDDVGMAGENEIGPPGPEPRVEVQDRRRPGGLEGDELGCESSPGQEIAQIGQRPAVLRRHRATADQRARDLEREWAVRRHGPSAPTVRRAATSAAFRAPARPSRGRRRRSAARCWREGARARCSGCASRP